MNFNSINTIYYQYIKGIKVDKPFIVIESDDWGSIRISNKKVHDLLIRQNVDVHSNPFNVNDTLESTEDLFLLDKTLQDIFNDTGKKVVFTINTVLANPDFEKIEQDKFRNYYFEEFTETYNKYGFIENWEKIRNMILAGYFYPQFHAREHVNVLKWLKMLQIGHKDFRIAFENGVFSLDYAENSGRKKNLMAAYWYSNDEEENFINKSIEEGLTLFKNKFGISSVSTIAPVGIWDTNQEKIFNKSGVKYFQSFLLQKIPRGMHLDRTYKFFGQKNGCITYFPRNVYFEPSTNNRVDWVTKAFSQVERAIYFKKPAIISSHRMNFVGGMDARLRDENVRKFDGLIRRIIKKWPDIKFVSSDKINDLI